MNSCNFIGRLTADPEVREVGDRKNKVLVCHFTIAVYRDKDNTDFIKCVAFNSSAEMLEKYFNKGDLIGITGHFRQNTYTNKDKETVYDYQINVSEISFCGNNKNN